MFSYLCAALVIVAACTAQVQVSTGVHDPQNAICKLRNAYYKVDSSCDSYVECTDFVATEKFCPDGLNYNPDAKWPDYPCGYPMDVPCRSRSYAQPAQPTANCPRQYGYFASPVATSDNCGQYLVCSAGKAVEMVCSVGLAFNPDTGRCDWPDQVPSCKTDQYLGFSCPAARTDVVVNYKYEGNCYYFFSCQKGQARLLSCDSGLAFDPDLGRCVDEDDVKCEVTPLVAQP